MRDRAACGGDVNRYAPWLQKALRIKEQSERFWRFVRTFVEADAQRVFARYDGNSGPTLLHEAATCGAATIVAFLLDVLQTQFAPETCGGMLQSVDTSYSQTTPLIAACQSSEGMMTQRLEVVRLLVRAGSDVARQDAHGDNALHWCARKSHATLLRYFLKETDAGVAAVVTENYKREKPLDIAKRQLERKPSLLSTAAFNLLRQVDRTCNIRVKLQLVKRIERQRQAEASALEALELYAALESASAARDKADQMWSQALQQAEVNRQTAENAHVEAAVRAASQAASEWLASKDGKSYLKKQLPIATQELKLEVQSGKVAKPKDMKKAAAQRVQDAFCREKAALARRAAIDAFRATTPAYPRELVTPPATLRSVLRLPQQ